MQRAETRSAQAPLAVPAKPGEIIPFADAHVHLNDPAMQLALMERYGASHAVVFWGGRSSNESVAEAVRQHPGRLIAFASISPERTAYRPAWESGDESLLKQLDALLATGLYKGIGEISATHFPAAGFAETDFSPTGPMMTGILLLARKYRVPVLVHVEQTRIAAPAVARLHHPARRQPRVARVAAADRVAAASLPGGHGRQPPVASQ